MKRASDVCCCCSSYTPEVSTVATRQIVWSSLLTVYNLGCLSLPPWSYPPTLDFMHTLLLPILITVHEIPMGLDAKTYWLTDCQSQCDFHFDFLLGSVVRPWPDGNGVSAWSWRISTVRSRCQGTVGEATAGWNRFSGCCGASWIVEISRGAVLTCTYESYQWSAHSQNQTPSIVTRMRDNIIIHSLFICLLMSVLVECFEIFHHIWSPGFDPRSRWFNYLSYQRVKNNALISYG
jgi:hypothetical protein